MRAIIQRVSSASIVINGEHSSKMKEGLVVLLGVSEDDNAEYADYLADKVAGLRIFSDSEDKLNLSVQDISGEILVVSNFTLYGDCRKGRRPSFIKAAKPTLADPLYNRFVEKLRTDYSLNVHTGEFGADMQITLTNDGPVTIIMDTDSMIKA